MQRGGTPTCKDRVFASIMGAKAAELLCEGKSNRVVAYRSGQYVDLDIQEALQMKKDIPEEQYEIAKDAGKITAGKRAGAHRKKLETEK